VTKNAEFTSDVETPKTRKTFGCIKLSQTWTRVSNGYRTIIRSPIVARLIDVVTSDDTSFDSIFTATRPPFQVPRKTDCARPVPSGEFR
jgi:hypothetical protein